MRSLRRRKTRRLRKREADSGTDPLNVLTDEVWWGFIEESEDFEWATANPTN